MGGEGRTIVVVGAGIGGLCAALALAEAGFRIVVVERADRLSDAGAGIQIAPNAGRVLARLGLDDAIAVAATEPEAIEIRSGATGELITALPAAAFRERYGFPYRVIHRADLQTILVRAVATNRRIELVLGATVADTLAREDGLLVRIRKPHGSEVATADGIVAADGVWSAFRQKIAGSAKAVASGETAWRALVPANVVGGTIPMSRTGLWLGRDAHLVHYPIANGAAVNIVAIVREGWNQEGWNAAGDRAVLIGEFRAWPEPIRRLLAAAHAWRKFAILTVDPAGPWCDGRMALLGDAAHASAPFLAQGAAMAIEDAAVLADCLNGAADIGAAFRAYEAARKPRVTKVAEASRKTGAQYHYSTPLSYARDLALRFAGPRLILERNDWIYRWEAPPPRT